jgi:hypothetical protein
MQQCQLDTWGCSAVDGMVHFDSAHVHRDWCQNKRMYTDSLQPCLDHSVVNENDAPRLLLGVGLTMFKAIQLNTHFLTFFNIYIYSMYS